MILPTTSKEFAQIWLIPIGVSILVNILFNRWQSNRASAITGISSSATTTTAETTSASASASETPSASKTTSTGLKVETSKEEEKVNKDQIREWIESEVRSQTIQLYSVTSPRASKPSTYLPVAHLPSRHQLRILVTGGAGFVGSHLVDRLMMQGHRVIVADNMFTGRAMNVQQWHGHPNFQLIIHDIVEPLYLEVDQIYHLACPASPPHYQYNPIKTIKTNTQGTLNMLGLAKRVGARMLLTSTSEVYGDPEIHPQKETYWGNVNPIGPRACYDEGKRVAETMMYAYQQQGNVDVRVARIFNTFGPRMHPNDGRVVSNFIIQALQNKDITIYGNGEQTRSFQFVDDLVSGLIALMSHDYTQPVNLGNPDEYTVKEFASLIRDLTQSESEIKFLPATQDDPRKRKPDITVAKEQLGWAPVVDVKTGLLKTINYFRMELEESGEIEPTGPDAVRPNCHTPPPGRKYSHST